MSTSMMVSSMMVTVTVTAPEGMITLLLTAFTTYFLFNCRRILPLKRLEQLFDNLCDNFDLASQIFTSQLKEQSIEVFLALEQRLQLLLGQHHRGGQLLQAAQVLAQTGVQKMKLSPVLRGDEALVQRPEVLNVGEQQGHLLLA
ncbi:hypothetical protein TYRP_013945 [Tyrophagus putrescentiae]|nr:hypothetical protein TYRP_013945 [Tyrophagus putrescentiae]